MPASNLFLDLTPDRVLEAVEAAGLPTTGLCYPLNSFENRVYEVELVTGERRVAKFYRPGRWSREEILEEHTFLAELAGAEVPALPPLPFPEGGTLRTIEGIHYAIWARFGGRAPDELDDRGVARLGRLVARIHQVGARGGGLARRPLDPEHYVRRPLAFLREHRLLPARLEERYVRAAETVATVAEERLAGVEIHRIHGDLHLGNLLYRDGLLWVLDFDDMAMGPAVQDVWLAVPGRDAESLRQRAVLLAAYEELRLFDRRTLALVEPLRGLRMVRYAAWIARRWDDPAFRVAWPEFGTPEWWRDETEDLEAQVVVIAEQSTDAALVGESVRSADAAEGDGWSNADYFWDWEG